MAVDFTNPHLKPRISCDSCCLEDHSVQNLISGNPVERSRGFMCDYFVSPPVTITVEFPCQVELKEILIDPWVSNQKSCGFQIFTRCEDVTSWLLDDSSSQSGSGSGDVIDLTSEMGMIGRRSVNEGDIHPTFVFTNEYFRDRREFQRLRMPERVFPDGNVITTSLRNKELKHTREVSHLVITINWTLNRTIPCIKSLAIYGQPSRKCPKNVIERISSILHALQQAPVKLPEPKDVPAENGIESEPFVENERTPPEYLDEITCELMAMPILLPSGHNINQRTLDRFIAEEAVWGRKPSDPFTGLPFGENKPIVNSGLKARIEQYIVKERIENVGRTIGRGSAVLHQQEKPSTSKRRRTSENSDDDCKIVKTVKSENSKSEIQFVKPSVSSFKTDVKKTKPNTNGLVTQIGESSSSKRPKFGRNHDQNLNSSLEDALGATLRNLPSFTAPVKKNSSNVCSECSTTLTPHKTYKISCGHYLCDVCVKQCRICKVCSKEFTNHDIVKANL